MLHVACASAPRTPSPPSAIQSLAKYNRKPSQAIENKHQRPKPIASFCRLLALMHRFTIHNSRITPFLFDTNERPRKKLNLFTTNKMTFLFDTFGRFSGLLFDTFVRRSICLLRFEIRQSPLATVELPPYDPHD
jgi:hypothetical protein